MKKLQLLLLLIIHCFLIAPSLASSNIIQTGFFDQEFNPTEDHKQIQRKSDLESKLTQERLLKERPVVQAQNEYKNSIPSSIFDKEQFRGLSEEEALDKANNQLKASLAAVALMANPSLFNQKATDIGYDQTYGELVADLSPFQHNPNDWSTTLPLAFFTTYASKYWRRKGEVVGDFAAERRYTKANNIPAEGSENHLLSQLNTMLEKRRAAVKAIRNNLNNIICLLENNEELNIETLNKLEIIYPDIIEGDALNSVKKLITDLRRAYPDTVKMEEVLSKAPMIATTGLHLETLKETILLIKEKQERYKQEQDRIQKEKIEKSQATWEKIKMYTIWGIVTISVIGLVKFLIRTVLRYWSFTHWACSISILLLGLAVLAGYKLLSFPAGYYTFSHLYIFLLSIWLGFIAWKQEKNPFFIVLPCLLVLLYQPFVTLNFNSQPWPYVEYPEPIDLISPIWTWIHTGTILLLILLSFINSREPSPKQK